jgi:PAS domain S-box-containing protein
MRIRAKLFSVFIILVLVPLLVVALLSLGRFRTALQKASEQDLEHLVRYIYYICNVHREMSQSKDQAIDSLKDEIKNIKVGKTGYAYIIDGKGDLVIHPAKEGTNIFDSKDSSGFEYIRAMIENAMILSGGELGTIHYQWINPELGETKPRQKINKYIYFKPWDWIISAGTYEEEVYEDLYKTERFIIIIVIISIAMVLIITIMLSKLLTDPIRELTDITRKMADGDLSQSVNITGTDEVSVLGTSFNRLISQIHDYTSNLEKMVGERTMELKESQERYRALSLFLNTILDSSTEYAIIALDLHGDIIEFNKGAENLFGWKKEEVVNKENIRITFTPEDIVNEVQKEISTRTIKEGMYDLEMYRIRKDGSKFPAYSTITAIQGHSENDKGFLEVVLDITKRKGLERELRETKDFLENIMESSVDGIITTDLKGKITYMNRAMEESLQYIRKELFGIHISNFYVKGIQQAREIMDILRTNERTQNYEIAVKRRDGKVYQILTSLFLLRDDNNQIIGTAGIFKDITEKKILESKLKAARARLVEASKMRALGELVAGVAHEINNPLMASQTILYVISQNLSQDHPERKRLELIGKCNDRIERIVDHLRKFSRQTKTEFILLDINQPIENALIMTGQLLMNHDIIIEKQLSTDLPKVLGDINQLEQVFLNILSNARDAMQYITGEKIVTISSSLIEEDGKPYVTVTFKDTGAGIPKKNMNKIIEPFFTTKPVGKGTGLGLSLCFGIIESHGGRIDIQSELGKGTDVKIFIPVNKNML